MGDSDKKGGNGATTNSLFQPLLDPDPNENYETESNTHETWSSKNSTVHDHEGKSINSDNISLLLQRHPKTFLNNTPLPPFVLECIQQLVIVATLLCHYCLLGLVSWACSPLMELLASALENSGDVDSEWDNVSDKYDSGDIDDDREKSIRETLGFVLVFYGIAFPLIAYLWVFLTALVVIILKKTVLFPLGVRAACYAVHDPPTTEQEVPQQQQQQQKSPSSSSSGTRPIPAPSHKVRYEITVSSIAYLRWWILDHLVRVTSPFIFGAVLTRTRIATLWYWGLGMNVNPFRTHVSSAVGVAVGGAECEFWTLRGSGTALDMRAYGIYAVPTAEEEDWGVVVPRIRPRQKKILYFVERAERRDDIVDEMPNGPVNILLAWMALLPSTIAIGLAPYAVGYPLVAAFALEFHSFPSYLAMLLFFTIAAPLIAAALQFVAHILCLQGLSNLIVECIDILPLVFAGSSIKTACLKLHGVKVDGEGIFSCIFGGWRIFSVGNTPQNPRSVSIGEETFLSNATMVGPIELGRRSFAGLRARLRPGTKIDEGGGVGAQSIAPVDCHIKRDHVLVRDWKKERLHCQELQSRSAMRVVAEEASMVSGETFEPFVYSNRIEHRILALNKRGTTATSLHGDSFLRTDITYVFHRIVQFTIILVAMSADFALWHHLLGSPFFLEHTRWEGIQFLGVPCFMLFFNLAILPVLMIVTKWATIGNFRNKFDLEPGQRTSKYFQLEDKTARTFFSFVSAPVWTAFRTLWQPRFYGTRTQNLIYAALGANIGTDVHIFSNGVEDYDTLTLGNASTVCHGCFVLGHIWEGQGITFGYTVISRGATILSDRQVWPGANVGAYEIIEGGGKPLREHQSGITRSTSSMNMFKNVHSLLL